MYSFKKCTFVDDSEKFCTQVHMHKGTYTNKFTRLFTLTVLLIASKKDLS